MLDAQSLFALLQQLYIDSSRDTKKAGWSTCWQLASESIWQTLQGGIFVHDECLNIFISILCGHESHFALARLVIPELRTATSSPVTIPQLRRVLDATAHLRHARAGPSAMPEQDPLHLAEKRLFHDSEMHRARIIAYQTVGANTEIEEKVKKW